MNLLKQWVCILLVTLISLSSFSQPGIDTSKTYQFKNGLLVNAPSRYGREALYTDELAYKLYTGTLKTPVDGQNFGKDDKGEAIVWKAVTADSANRLFLRGQGRGGFGRSGYIYLTYISEKDQVALLNVRGNSSLFFRGTLHTGDPYSSGWLYIPVRLKKGLNEFYVRGTFLIGKLLFPSKRVFLNTEDPTLPFIVNGQDNRNLAGAIVLINTTQKELKGLKIKSNIGGKDLVTDIPAVPAMSTKKVMFHFDGTGVSEPGKFDCQVSVLEKGKVIDEAKIQIESVDATKHYSNTFVSAIDGSLQYYAVTPQSSPTKEGGALFLSVHGAGVEAIGQARAYKPKDWGNLVAATNRRPRGFNWEDWGRLDALEVLNLARQKFKPDPQLIYLTGHSMGGHGTWFLGATYPDKWAAIAPCAGYPTLKGYGSADGLIPDSSNSPMEQMLLRSGNQSDVIRLASNYKPLGVYIFHGDSDRVVSVNYARQMRKILSDFHPDISYYEYPGGEHWFGDHSVDWKPLFDFFKWHSRPVDSAVDRIEFTTANPGISSSFRWACVAQQIHPLQYSRLLLNRNKKASTITGNTENVQLLKLNLNDFKPNATVKIVLDNSALETITKSGNDSIFLLKENGKWIIAERPSVDQKGPHRYGTFKEAFNHNMVFVYSTKGTKEENEWSYNKALYDAETWYYRGNGAVDIIADTEFSLAIYKDRGVIIFGNKNTNAAWKELLNDCPIQVERNRIIAGTKTWQGQNLGAYFTWPIRNSPVASVAVISGTGLAGMKAANANQYFAGASGFPDYMIFDLDMLQTGAAGVKFAGFFDNNWKLSEAHMVDINLISKE